MWVTIKGNHVPLDEGGQPLAGNENLKKHLSANAKPAKEILKTRAEAKAKGATKQNLSSHKEMTSSPAKPPRAKPEKFIQHYSDSIVGKTKNGNPRPASATNPKNKGYTLNEKYKAAQGIYDKARKVEPEITDAMIDLCVQNGTYLEGCRIQ